jgi:hypothetical protein
VSTQNEVYASFTYEPADHVRARRLLLLQRVSESGAPRLLAMMFGLALLARIAMPPWLSYALAGMGAVFTTLLAVGVALAWTRAAGGAAPTSTVDLSVSEDGVSLRRGGGGAHVHLEWKSFRRYSKGFGLYVLQADRGPIVVPRRALRDEDVEVLEALLELHPADPSGGPKARASSEEDDGEDGD